MASCEGLTRVVGHGRPGDVHGVQTDKGWLEQTRLWRDILRHTEQGENKTQISEISDSRVEYFINTQGQIWLIKHYKAVILKAGSKLTTISLRTSTLNAFRPKTKQKFSHYFVNV